MSEKEEYLKFCEENYVPIYSKSWWMDAVCGKVNWNVWLYREAGMIKAAMPYYVEYRNGKKYITKALLTQNNGIIFPENVDMKLSTKQAFEERVINAACEYIATQDCAVYEQQYQYTFDNWLPFFWNGYKAICRYTYVIEDTSDLDQVWGGISSKLRAIIRKGQRNISDIIEVDEEVFYTEHKKIFDKQGLDVPFSKEQWGQLYKTVKNQKDGVCLAALNDNKAIVSVIYLVWDEKSMYHLLGGGIPEFQNLDTYDALTWHAIHLASEKGLKYDFEGSVIKRIAKSFREFGGVPKPYFRIRKVFDPEIIMDEAKLEIERISMSGR